MPTIEVKTGEINNKIVLYPAEAATCSGVKASVRSVAFESAPASSSSFKTSVKP